MPTGDIHAKPELSLEARKRLLLVACTIDRLHLLNTWKRPASNGVLGPVASTPWFEFAAQLAPYLLPRKFRFLWSLWRGWSQTQARS